MIIFDSTDDTPGGAIFSHKKMKKHHHSFFTACFAFCECMLLLPLQSMCAVQRRVQPEKWVKQEPQVRQALMKICSQKCRLKK